MPSVERKSAGTKLLISCWRTAAPPSFVVVDDDTIFTFANTPASSEAATETAPPAVTLEFVTVACARLETLLLATMAPTLLPLAPKSADATELAAFETVALISAALSALTVTSPVTFSVEPLTDAVVAAGCSPLKADETSGSPSSASTVLKRKFCAFQPIELNASVKPKPSAPVEVAVRIVASIAAVEDAETTSDEAVRFTLRSDALAEASTTFVTSWPVAARTSPVP